MTTSERGGEELGAGVVGPAGENMGCWISGPSGGGGKRVVICYFGLISCILESA